MASTIPKIDFNGLEPAARPRGDRWCAARAQVMQALESHGCFVAVYDKITPELQDAVFETSAKELFGLPLEAKIRNVSNKPLHGYVGQIPGIAYESLGITDPHQFEGAQRFATLMWSQGNPFFCESVVAFAKVMREIELMARRMILEGLGIDKYFDTQNESMNYGLRLAAYGSPPGTGDEEAKEALQGHYDANILSLVYQYRVPGLEILWNGEWIGVPPATNSVNVQIGESLEAWTNGRMRATHHRVTVGGHETRYSSVFGSYPKDGHMVTVPDDLVDEEHPLLYKPLEYVNWVNFRFSEEGNKAANKLEAYCGLKTGETKA